MGQRANGFERCPARWLARYAFVTLILVAHLSAAQVSVEGRVVGTTEALAKVKVSLHSAPTAFEIADRDRQGLSRWGTPLASSSLSPGGAFQLTVPAGAYALVADDGRGLRFFHWLAPLIEPAVVAPLELPGIRTMVVAVQDEAGTRLSDVRVAALDTTQRHAGSTSWSLDPTTSSTNDLGEVQLLFADDRPVTLQAVDSRGQASLDLVMAADLSAKRTLTLRVPEPSVAGSLVLVDSAGAPVAGARVLLVGPTPGNAPNMPSEGWWQGDLGATDSQGRLALEVPKTSRLMVLSRANGFAIERWTPKRRDANTGFEQEVTLEPGNRLVGDIVDAENLAPIAGAWATVWLDAPLGLRSLPMSTPAAAGQYSFPSHRPRHGFVWADAPGYLRPRPGRTQRAPRGPDFRLRQAAALRGRVVTDMGEPVAHAVLSAQLTFDSDSARAGMNTFSPHQTWSGPDGTFRFRSIDRGPLVLVTEAAGYPKTSIHLEGEGTPPKRAPSEFVEVVLSPGRLLRGQIIDSGGEPVSGAKVYYVDMTALPTMRRDDELKAVASISNEEGLFDIGPVLPSPALLKVESAAHAPLAHYFDVPEGDGDHHLEPLALDAGASITGSVRDDEGRPVPGVQISGLLDEELLPFGVRTGSGGRGRSNKLSGRSGRSLGITTDERGRFVVDGLKPGASIDLSFHSEGHSRHELPGLRPPLDGPVEVLLSRLATIRGRLVDEDGNPMVGRVSARGTSLIPSRSLSMLGFGPTATSSDDGSYVLEVPPGSNRLSARASGFRDTPGPVVNASEGQSIEVRDMVLRKGARVEGKVVDLAGEPVLANVSYQEGRTTRGHVSTNLEGLFSLSGLNPGRAKLLVRTETGARAEKTTRLSSGSNWVDIVVTGAFVRGDVVDQKGQPAEGATIRLDAAGASSIQTRSLEDGSFELPLVPPGAYSVTASAQGFSPTSLKRLEVGDEGVSGLRLSLGPTGHITGVVRGLTDREIADVDLRVNQRYAGGVRPDGSFEIDSVPLGDVWVVATLDEKLLEARAQVELTATNREGSATLQFDSSGYSLEARIRFLGEAIPGVGVRLEMPGGGPARTSRTDYQGRVRFDGLEAGSYVMTGTHAAQQLRTPRFEVTNDRNLEIHVDPLGGVTMH